MMNFVSSILALMLLCSCDTFTTWHDPIKIRQVVVEKYGPEIYNTQDERRVGVFYARNALGEVWLVSIGHNGKGVYSIASETLIFPAMVKEDVK